MRWRLMRLPPAKGLPFCLLCLLLIGLHGCGTGMLVERVAGCHAPRLALHLHNYPLRCRGDIPASRDDTDPQCYTVPVAGGPGMGGISPSHCDSFDEPVAATRPLPKEAPWRSVAAIKNFRGRVIGTGVLLTPNLILTASHVMFSKESKPISEAEMKPASVVFGNVRGHGDFVNGLAEESGWLVGYHKAVDNSTRPTTVLYDRVLDYVLFEIPIKRRNHLDGSCREIYMHNESWVNDWRSSGNSPNDAAASDCGIAPIDIPSFVALPSKGEKVHLLGYTANPFYPRGLIWSRWGKMVMPPPLPTAGLSLHYNLQTAPGFSGSPVFSANFAWIGMHTTAESNVALPDDKDRVVFDFSRPNGGHRIDLVLDDIACRLPYWLQIKYKLDHALAERAAQCQ